MKAPISITSLATVSALGISEEEIWRSYLNDKHYITEKQFENSDALVAKISEKDTKEILEIRNSDQKYKNLDNSVLYAMYVARKAIEKSEWKPQDNFGINIGSSRGATSLFEKYHKDFLNSKKAETLSSPTTTLGNISSWVAHDLQTNGPEISHSITCSTGLHAVLNGIAWLQSGMSDKFLVGASEASLTHFTIAQMKALKIYASKGRSYPCKAFDLQKKRNTMILGEAASVLCLESGTAKNAIAKIIGVGYATEILEHNISISTEASCFQKSMKMAIGNIPIEEIDAIVMHAPGTVKGDTSEYKAIKRVFCNKPPFLTTNKWKLGHTFSTSGILSIELAIFMLQHQQAIAVPYVEKQKEPSQLRKILINAVGFGGNAVSVLLTK
ncbi:MAG: beta-ketoacyl synthase [Flavobacteriaceae bacterium]|nr:beta-ketoacyl synthase [Flavobacteriaceae bacterium]